MDGLSKSYYLKPAKIIRDLVHEYVTPTRFDLELIDTVPFQRLSDIRQLTCQHVYPAARHTRFEHSLGVQQLMRNAIRQINKNGIIGKPPQADSEPIIDATLEFNAAVAALLHDIGHCPFSHMGEAEYDKETVRKALVKEVEEHPKLKGCTELLKKLRSKKDNGAVHEQLSCIVILRKYSRILQNLTHTAKKGEDECELETDFELIIRSILGIEYDVSTLDAFKDHKVHNIIVRLLNSKIIDVDKLDYIMRDSYLTAIGTPAIDTQRLFRNMYLDEQYCLVFTSRAVPSLQNMIDARDGLYSYVYNHHAVIYSDFLNTYISRRLSHNAKAFYKGVYSTEDERGLAAKYQPASLTALGIVPKTYLFSVESVADKHHADSAWLSLLNNIHIEYKTMQREVSKEASENEETALKEKIKSRLCEELDNLKPKADISTAEDGGGESPVSCIELSQEARQDMAERIYNSMQLIDQSMRRYYLKPWWKTVFEFSNFMRHYFRDDRVRRQLGRFICKDGEYNLKADEFRSQIAKHVIYITQNLEKNGKAKEFGLIKPLNEGDFFVIQRSPRFFAPDTIEGLEIALKNNEILGPPVNVNRRVHEYYIKSLTNIIPQKDYSSIYAKEGFYIFSKRISDVDLEKLAEQAEPNGVKKEQEVTKAKSQHYELLERIFAFVAKEFVDGGEQQFVAIFQNPKSNENVKTQIKEFRERMYSKFTGELV